MTWVVAASTLYGYGALFSDVQVTFKDGHTEDILQKAHPISNFIAAGFAGSVRIGFMLLQSLHEALRLSDEDLATLAWDLTGLARLRLDRADQRHPHALSRREAY